MSSLAYVFHNFIIIYHPFCFRKREDIFFPFMFLVTFSVIYFNLHFPSWGGGGVVTIFFLLLGGGITVFFDNCERGVENFFWHLKISPANPAAHPHPNYVGVPPGASIRQINLNSSR